MEGLLEESNTLLEEHEASPTRDAGLIAAAQKTEHYEIASYGTLRTFAEQLGYEEAVPLLEQNLAEEKETDELLTELATSEINEEAMSEE